MECGLAQYILSTLSSQPHSSHVRWNGGEGSSSLQGAAHGDSLHGCCERGLVLHEGCRRNVEDISDPTRVNLETLEDDGVGGDTFHNSHLSYLSVPSSQPGCVQSNLSSTGDLEKAKREKNSLKHKQRRKRKFTPYLPTYRFPYKA